MELIRSGSLCDYFGTIYLWINQAILTNFIRSFIFSSVKRDIVVNPEQIIELREVYIFLC